MPDYKFENLGDDVEICVSKVHTFGTDSFLLTDFAAPKPADKVCDLGTGCGIIPVLMRMKYGCENIIGVDIQAEAIEQFKITVEKNGFEKITSIEADIKTFADNEGKAVRGLDLVVCNPPYKANGAGIESLSEPMKIARHEILCGINDVCKTAAKLLRYGGRFCLCNRPERLSDVITAMKNANIEPKLLRFVSKNPDTPPWLFLMEGKLGSKPFMKVLPNLFIGGNVE